MSGLLLYIVLQLFSFLAAGFALVKGGVGERWAASVVVANLLIGTASVALTGHNVEMIRLANDGLAAMALLAITLRYGSFWLGGAMLLYAAEFTVHSFYIVTGRAIDLPYIIISEIAWNGVIWSLILGTVFAWRRRIRAVRAAAAEAPAA